MAQDHELRQAAFDHLARLVDHAGLISRQQMTAPFYCGAHRMTLVDPRRGIHRPQAMRRLLSLTTVMPSRGRKAWYEDQSEGRDRLDEPDDGISYSFMGSDPAASQNQSLREAAEFQIPIIYFVGVQPGLYKPLFPVYLADWHPALLRVKIVFPSLAGSWCRFPAEPDERRYAMRTVKQRLHQAQFRAVVLDAYSQRCAISGARLAELLDAAHIVPDANEELGFPVVSNGIALSKLHHAAYDANLLGIDDCGVVHVSHRLESKGAAVGVEYGLKSLAGARIRLPARERDRPDQQRLRQRFDQFRRADDKGQLLIGSFTT